MLSHHLSIRRERMLHLRSAHIQARFSEKQEFCSEKSVFINVTHTHTYIRRAKRLQAQKHKQEGSPEEHLFRAFYFQMQLCLMWLVV